MDNSMASRSIQETGGSIVVVVWQASVARKNAGGGDAFFLDTKPHSFEVSQR